MKLKLFAFFVILSNTAFGQKVHQHYWKDKIPNNPKGVWEFYSYKGELEQRYDFSNKVLLFQKSNPNSDTAKYKIIKGTDTLLTKLDSPPAYIGATSVISKVISSSLKYPKEARENGVQGVVKISFIVDQNGKTSGHKIIQKVGGGCDEEALRVIQLIPDNWIPGILNGETVITEFIILVTFRVS